MAQVAKDFGISPSCLKRWLTIDDKKAADPSPAARAANESDALREANKRIRLLEQENEVLRRAAAYLSAATENVLDRRTWAAREEFRIAIVTWTEKTYHRRRRQSGLGRVAPTRSNTS